jgi:hypothetical protein
MGLFGKLFGGSNNDELPTLLEEGDELIGQVAVDKEGHEGVIDCVYVFPDGHKSVDIRNKNGLAHCGLEEDEYRIK